MSDTCIARLVGQVMATSASIDPVSLSDPGAIRRFEQEIALAPHVYAKEIAEYRAKGWQEQSPSLPSDPVAKKRPLDRTLICSVLCCCEQNPARGAGSETGLRPCGI